MSAGHDAVGRKPGGRPVAVPVAAARARPPDAPSIASHTTTAPLATPNPHFARLGGEATIARLVAAFYAAMETRSDAVAIRAMHPADLAGAKGVLQRYLVEWTGGPALYSVERGHPRLRRKHLPFAIGAAERDAWLACMRDALAATVADPPLREELLAAFTRTADFIRNDEGSTHDHHRHDPVRRP